MKDVECARRVRMQIPPTHDTSSMQMHPYICLDDSHLRSPTLLAYVVIRSGGVAKDGDRNSQAYRGACRIHETRSFRCLKTAPAAKTNHKKQLTAVSRIKGILKTDEIIISDRGERREQRGSCFWSLDAYSTAMFSKPGSSMHGVLLHSGTV